MSTRAVTGPAVGVRTALAGSAVRRGARVTGAVADAVVAINAHEHQRRVGFGLHGVEHLGLLDALMCLPVGAAVPVADLSPVALAHLRASPPGCVNWLDGGSQVRRLLVSAAAIDLVVVRTAHWRAGLYRAEPFEPFATRVVLLQRPPRTLVDIAWEADAAGVGLWVRQPDAQIDEIVAPAPFVRRYVKPAGWRFAERAYAAWVNATDQ